MPLSVQYCFWVENNSKLNLYIFWSKKRKVFQNQYVIAWDLKILCRYTAQSDVGSIEKCIWFTAREMVDGSIISKFPGIARGIDYLISHFSQKVHHQHSDKETLMGLCEKLRYNLQRSEQLFQDREAMHEHQNHMYYSLKLINYPIKHLEKQPNHRNKMFHTYISTICVLYSHYMYISWLSHSDNVVWRLGNMARSGLNHFETTLTSLNVY